MISALHQKGLESLRGTLLDHAKPGAWKVDAAEFTDQWPEDVAMEVSLLQLPILSYSSLFLAGGARILAEQDLAKVEGCGQAVVVLSLLSACPLWCNTKDQVHAVAVRALSSFDSFIHLKHMKHPQMTL